MITTSIDIALLTMLVITAVALVRLRGLISMVMLSGIFSLLSAALFMTLDAVDVAFTEAAVGAGITTILLLSSLTLTGTDEKPPRISWVPLFVVMITGAALVYATLDMPYFGDPEAPIHQHVAPHYIYESAHEVGPPNIVTSVLASYRGYDTLGEVTVIFTAGIGVLILLGRKGRKTEGSE